MPSDRFSISKFLDGCVGMSYADIIYKAENEVRFVESISYGVKGCVANREAGSTQYAAELKSFLFFMRHGTKPATGAFHLYLPVVKSLVDSGEFKASALDLFHRSSAS